MITVGGNINDCNMSYELYKLRPLAAPMGIDGLDLMIWNELPDLWGDCASERSKKKYRRQRRREELLKQGYDTTGTAPAIQ